MTDTATSYDEIPYTSFPYPLSHPDRLATVGRLFGMEPADVASARVLELGCASGGNLIPIAEQLPSTELVGVDLSARQVEEGTSAIEELGLHNVSLRHADLETVDADWGEFDYVVCHGVFSWVPDRVQDRILQICADNLAPQGIAFISYNTYPGWHLRESIRHMMLFHAAQFPGARERTEQAAALIDFLASAADEHDIHAALLQRELEVLARTSPEYLFHEHLEEHNTPCYFHEFAERLVPRGLQYLGEADVHTMLPRELAPEVAETLGRISPDIIALEQYMDFVRNRQFRQTLVCRADVVLDRRLRPDCVPRLHVAFDGSPPEEPLDLTPDVVQSFGTDGEIVVSSAAPITKAALSIAQDRWPDAAAFGELYAAACERMGDAGLDVPESAREQLAVDLFACFLQGTIELRTSRPVLCTDPGPRPQVSAYARWQAARGDFVTSRRHVRVDLDEPARRILGLLDGTRDRAALTDALVDLLGEGTLTLSHDDEQITDPERARGPLREIVEKTLAELTARALLIA